MASGDYVVGRDIDFHCSSDSRPSQSNDAGISPAAKKKAKKRSKKKKGNAKAVNSDASIASDEFSSGDTSPLERLNSEISNLLPDASDFESYTGASEAVLSPSSRSSKLSSFSDGERDHTPSRVKPKASNASSKDDISTFWKELREQRMQILKFWGSLDLKEQRKLTKFTKEDILKVVSPTWRNVSSEQYKALVSELYLLYDISAELLEDLSDEIVNTGKLFGIDLPNEEIVKTGKLFGVDLPSESLPSASVSENEDPNTNREPKTLLPSTSIFKSLPSFLDKKTNNIFDELSKAVFQNEATASEVFRSNAKKLLDRYTGSQEPRVEVTEREDPKAIFNAVRSENSFPEIFKDSKVNGSYAHNVRTQAVDPYSHTVAASEIAGDITHNNGRILAELVEKLEANELEDGNTELGSQSNVLESCDNIKDNELDRSLNDVGGRTPADNGDTNEKHEEKNKEKDTSPSKETTKLLFSPNARSNITAIGVTNDQPESHSFNESDANDELTQNNSESEVSNNSLKISKFSNDLWTNDEQIAHANYASKRLREFCARMFEQRILNVYRAHIASEKQEQLLAELADEEMNATSQTPRKSKEKENKKKSKKLQAKQQREAEAEKKALEEKLKKEAAREKEAARRAQQLEAQRAKEEAHRLKIERRMAQLALETKSASSSSNKDKSTEQLQAKSVKEEHLDDRRTTKEDPVRVAKHRTNIDPATGSNHEPGRQSKEKPRQENLKTEKAQHESNKLEKVKSEKIKSTKHQNKQDKWEQVKEAFIKPASNPVNITPAARYPHLAKFSSPISRDNSTITQHVGSRYPETLLNSSSRITADNVSYDLSSSQMPISTEFGTTHDLGSQQRKPTSKNQSIDLNSTLDSNLSLGSHNTYRGLGVSNISAGVAYNSDPVSLHTHQSQSPIPQLSNLWTPAGVKSTVPHVGNVGIPSQWKVTNSTPWGDDRTPESTPSPQLSSKSPWKNIYQPQLETELLDATKLGYSKLKNLAVDGFVPSHMLFHAIQSKIGAHITLQDMYQACKRLSRHEFISDDVGLITHIKL